jgi:hypothetical protein
MSFCHGNVIVLAKKGHHRMFDSLQNHGYRESQSLQELIKSFLATHRVTRLGDFSMIGILLDAFLKRWNGPKKW